MTHFAKAHKKEEHGVAAYLLYAASILGIFELFTSATVIGKYTNLVALDIIVYVALFAIAVMIHKGKPFMKWLYAIIAIAWYVSLIFVLPADFGHSLNLFVAFMQIAATVLAYCFLLAP